MNSRPWDTYCVIIDSYGYLHVCGRLFHTGTCSQLGGSFASFHEVRFWSVVLLPNTTESGSLDKLEIPALSTPSVSIVVVEYRE